MTSEQVSKARYIAQKCIKSNFVSCEDRDSEYEYVVGPEKVSGPKVWIITAGLIMRSI